MQTFGQSPFDLCEADLVTYDDAIENAGFQNDLCLRVNFSLNLSLRKRCRS